MERRYRAALDWYPRRWRDENGEAMLGTLLDEAEATGRDRPRPTDLANLAVHGIAATARQLPDRVPAAIRDRASAIALATGFALALVQFLAVEWAPWAPNGPWNGWAFDWRGVNADVPGFGPFASAGVILYGLWLAAFVLAIVGLARTATVALVATLPVIVVLVANSGHRMVAFRPADIVLVSFAALALLAVLGRPTRRGHKAAGARWLGIAAGIALVLPSAFAVLAIVGRLGGDPRFELRLDPWGSWYQLANPVLFLVAAAGLALVAFARGHRDWTLALALTSVPWAIASVGLVAGGGGIGAIAGWTVLAVAALTLGYLVLRERGYRIALVRRD